MSVTVGNLFFYISRIEGEDEEVANFCYRVNDRYYDADEMFTTAPANPLYQVPTFTINLDRSQVITLTLEKYDDHNDETSYSVMLYQWDFFENHLVEISSRPNGFDRILSICGINIPDMSIPPGEDLIPHDLENMSGIFVGLNRFINLEVRSFPDGITAEVFNEILRVTPVHIHQVPVLSLGLPPLAYLRIEAQRRPLHRDELEMFESLIREQTYIQPSKESIHQIALEAFFSQYYGLPINLPKELPLNGLRVPFISFNEAIQKLSQNDIQRFVIDPLFQPWAGKGNRIITLFDQDGSTYLVRAIYDSKINRIFPPV